MGREEAKGGDNEGVKREKKQKEEKKWESLLWERLNEWKKIFFPRLEEDNIYRSYALCERDIVFQFFFFRKQPIKNRPYFYKSFPLTKDSFLLTKIFFMPPHIEKWRKLYRRFSSETNRALLWI